MVGQSAILPEQIVLPADARGHSQVRHELRTYLNYIVGYTEMVLEDAEERRWRTGRRQTEDALETARDLTESVGYLLRSLESGDRAQCAGIINGNVQPAVLGIRRAIGRAATDARANGLEESAADLDRVLQGCDHLMAATERGLRPADAPGVDRAPTRPPTHVQSPETEPASGEKERASARILAVDDNAANLALLARFCGRRGHDVTQARSGEAALRELSEKEYDLVILDIMLPGISGFEVMESMRHAPAMNVPVIVLSSLDDMESMVTCLRMGAQDFMRKPFVAEILEARIDAQLQAGRAAGSASAGAQAGQKNPHGLSKREIEVLAHLAMGKSNREIGEDLFITENTVVRHVSSVFTKAGLANRAEAGVYAVRLGLVE